MYRPLILAAALLPAVASAAPLPATLPDACLGVKVGSAPGGLPFPIGEELSYDVTVKGVYVGRFETKVGKPRLMNGHRVLPLFGRARTNSFASNFEKLLGRYMTFVDSSSLRPQLVRVESTYGVDRRDETARFSSGETNVKTDFIAGGKGGTRSFETEAPLYDVISALFYARTRLLDRGVSACQEVYADKRLWRMDARVRGLESVSTPAGDRPAYVVETTWERLPHPDFDPKKPAPRVEVDVYLSTDPTRTPLAFDVRLRKIEARASLMSWSLEGRERDEAWTF